MSYIRDFPGTKEYDQDLGWLIKAYKNVGQGLDDLEERVSKMEELYDSIPETINAAIAEMKTQVNAAIADINARMVMLEKNVEDTLAEFTVEFNNLVAKLNATWADIHKYLDSQVNYMKGWVKAYLEQWAQEYPYLICPVDGSFEPLQEILWHLYNDLSWGIPVNEFDGLQLTAQELDDMRIPARKLDKWGKLLFLQRRFCYMFSPFTGMYEPISDVVLALARLHQNAVTAQEFDNADLDVEMLDEKNVSAYDFDWTSVWFDEISGGKKDDEKYMEWK